MTMIKQQTFFFRMETCSLFRTLIKENEKRLYVHEQ